VVPDFYSARGGYWFSIFVLLFFTWAVGIYTNSRHANPALIPFEVQNRASVIYEDSKLDKQLMHLLGVKARDPRWGVEDRKKAATELRELKRRKGIL